MKTKQSITAGVAFAALVIGWAARAWQRAWAKEREFEARWEECALQRFEDEGGLVPAF